MSRLREVARRVWRLFVDDGPATLLLLGWIAIVAALSRAAHLGAVSGPLLFAGIAAITLITFAPRR